MSTQPHETEEYKAGQAAARQGLPVISCPHTLDTPQGELWVQGWEQTTDNMQRVAHGLAASALAAGGIMEHPKPNTGADVERLGEVMRRVAAKAPPSKEFQEGFEASRAGKAMFDNPYPAYDGRASDWGLGWKHAKAVPIMAAGSDNPPRKAGTTPLHLEAGKIVQKHITHATATPDYCRGFEARKDGKNLWDNPHATTSHAHAEWKRGWETAHHLGSARRDATTESTVLPVSELAKPGTWEPVGDASFNHGPIPEEVKAAWSVPAVPITMEQAKEAWNNPPPPNGPNLDEMNKAITPACPFCGSTDTRLAASYLPRHHMPNATRGVCLACGAQGPRQPDFASAISAWAKPDAFLQVPFAWHLHPGFLERMEHELCANEPQKGPFTDWKPTAVQAMEELLHHVRKLATWTDKCEQVPTIMAGHEPEMLNVARYQASQKAAELAADVGNIAMKVWEIFGNAPLPSVAAETDPNKAPA